MTGLLIVAHGSRRKESNEEVFALTNKIKSISGNTFNCIKCAFLSIAEPDVKSQIALFAEKKSEKIIIFPLFLAAGNHVTTDLPNMIKDIEKKYPEISFKIAPHLGGLKGIENIILEQVKIV